MNKETTIEAQIEEMKSKSPISGVWSEGEKEAHCNGNGIGN